MAPTIDQRQPCRNALRPQDLQRTGIRSRVGPAVAIRSISRILVSHGPKSVWPADWRPGWLRISRIKRGCEQSGGASYREVAQFLRTSGDPQHVAADLEQWSRRVAFNVGVGNRDDHLRDHGFLLSGNGWPVAPAFDANPNIDKSDHVVNIDDQDNRSSLATVAETSAF